MEHIIGRGLEHFFAAPGVMLACAFALAVLCRRKAAWDWLPKSKGQILISAGLIVFGATACREGWDVAHGQPLVKVFTDHASWLAGLGCGVWGLFRWDSWK